VAKPGLDFKNRRITFFKYPFCGQVYDDETARKLTLVALEVKYAPRHTSKSLRAKL
jgi:hypothetical protein